MQPEQKSAPKSGLITIAGIAGGFTFGVMLALLRGGLARMQHNPATRDKLVLLKALWKSGSAKSTVPGVPTAQAVPAEPTAVKDLHPRPEATG